MGDVLTLAKYIVTKCVRDCCPISNLQLQKILYFIQVDALKTTGEPAFLNNIEAWQFGPVVPEVYYYFVVLARCQFFLPMKVIAF